MATKTAAGVAGVSRGDATRYAPPGGSHVQRFAPASSGGALVTHTRSHGAAAPCGAASSGWGATAAVGFLVVKVGTTSPPRAAGSPEGGGVYAKPLARQLLSAGPPGTGSREPGPRVASAGSEPREPSEPVLLLYQTERPPGARDQAGCSALGEPTAAERRAAATGVRAAGAAPASSPRGDGHRGRVSQVQEDAAMAGVAAARASGQRQQLVMRWPNPAAAAAQPSAPWPPGLPRTPSHGLRSPGSRLPAHGPCRPHRPGPVRHLHLRLRRI